MPSIRKSTRRAASNGASGSASQRPALISVDLANAWTRPGNPFTCDEIDDQIIPPMQRLLKACRQNGHPVIHGTTAYEITDVGLWHCKIPIEAVNLADKDLSAIDSRIAPMPGEHTVLKRRAGAFHGNPLADVQSVDECVA